jgi:transcriptional regulator with XRE-family HTH domain
MNKVAVGMKIKELREKKKLTVTDVQHLTGLSRPTIYQIETGDRVPNKATMRKLADALSSTVEEIEEMYRAPNDSVTDGSLQTLDYEYLKQRIVFLEMQLDRAMSIISAKPKGVSVPDVKRKSRCVSTWAHMQARLQATHEIHPAVRAR